MQTYGREVVRVPELPKLDGRKLQPVVLGSTSLSRVPGSTGVPIIPLVRASPPCH